MKRAIQFSFDIQIYFAKYSLLERGCMEKEHPSNYRFVRPKGIKYKILMYFGI